MNVTRLPIRAGALITGLALLATMVLASAFSHWECQDPLRFAVYACLAAASGTLKIRLPESTSTFSLSFVFVLLGVADLSLGETLAMLIGSMVVQTIWRSSHPARVAQSIFNLSAVTLCTALAFSSARSFRAPTMVELAIAAAVYFTSNTLAVSVINPLPFPDRCSPSGGAGLSGRSRTTRSAFRPWLSTSPPAVRSAGATPSWCSRFCISNTL